MSFRTLFMVCLLLSGIGRETWAQADFLEGILTYRIDTIRRLEPHSSLYRAVQFRLYKKADLIRVETLFINLADSTDWQRMIEIRNQQGIYSILEEKSSIPLDSLAKKLSMTEDSLRKALPWLNNFAQFTSYQEEKLAQSNAALQGLLKTYTINKVGKQARLLSMPTEQLVIISSDKKESIDVQVTQTIVVPVGLFFDALSKITGTPLQFTDSRNGWINQYTIDSLTTQSLPDNLFQVDPTLRVLTTEQLLKEVDEMIK